MTSVLGLLLRSDSGMQGHLKVDDFVTLCFQGLLSALKLNYRNAAAFPE
jgi:hypothetical protein